MTTKEQVLLLLQKSGSTYISGQEMADSLFVTRASIWKAIKSLEKEGYDIEAITNKGYRLRIRNILPSEALLQNLIAEYSNADGLTIPSIPVKLFESVESTNDTARDFATQNPDSECIFIADTQTKGRGRRGRDFFSPSGTGLYMSFLLYPNTDITEAMKYTCMMAECVYQAILSVTNIETAIKWVNDIYYNDKKIAGILTEGISSIEDGSLQYVIIGVGINLFNPYEDFPSDIKKVAGSLISSSEESLLESTGLGYQELRNRLYAAIVYEFMKHYRYPSEYPFLAGYQNHSMLTGKYVKIVSYSKNPIPANRKYALVTGIDDDCRLNIQYEDGTSDSLFSGEVSVVKY